MRPWTTNEPTHTAWGAWANTADEVYYWNPYFGIVTNEGLGMIWGNHMYFHATDAYFWKRLHDGTLTFFDWETGESFARFRRLGTFDWRFEVLQGNVWTTK
jgi:hypothetical protein